MPELKAERSGRMRHKRLRAVVQATFSLMFALVISIVGLMLNDHGLLWIESLDDQFGDLRTALFSPRAKAQNPDIALVIINENSLLDYPARSPIDRGLLADLVRIIDKAGPKAIGLDFVFDWRTEHDQELLATLKDTKSPIVLGAIDDQLEKQSDQRFKDSFRKTLAFQDSFLALAKNRAPRLSVGHLYLGANQRRLALGDVAVRRITSLPADARYPLSFAQQLAETVGKKPKTGDMTIAWQRPPADSRTPLFLRFDIPQHKPEERRALLEAKFEPSAWAGRIVLIGADMWDRDQHVTPFSVLDGSRLPGVDIHAHFVAEVLEGRGAQEPSRTAQILIVASVCLMFFWMGRCCQGHGFFGSWVGYAVVGILSWLIFATAVVVLPSGPMLAAWTFGAAAGRGSDRIFRSIGLENEAGG